MAARKRLNHLDSGCGFKSLEEGVHSNTANVLLCEVPELLGDLSEGNHAVIECVVPEENPPAPP